MTSTASNERAFSRVDLCVLVAMSFGLGVLVLPSVGQNRAVTKETVCSDNVGSLMRSTVQYAADHDGVLPHPNWTFNRNYAGWLCRPPFSQPVTNIEAGLLWPYLKSYSVYRCPSENTNAAAFQLRKQKYTSYVMNGAACFFEDQRTPETVAIAKLKADAIVFWQPDERNFRDYNDGASRPDEGSTRLHSGRTPVGNADGSAGTMTIQQFNTEALRRPGRLWWSPKSKDGLAALEKAFRNSSDADLRAREQKLVAAARDGRYFASISGLQGLRRDPNLTVQQLTAIQDAVGKMQSRLAERVAQGKEAQRHVNSLQSETERLRE